MASLAKLRELLERIAAFDEVKRFLDDNPDLNLNVATPAPSFATNGKYRSERENDDFKYELPLHLATYDVRIVDLLLDTGANPKSFCGHGRNAVQCTSICWVSDAVLDCLTRDYLQNEARTFYIKTYIDSLDERRSWRATHYIADSQNQDLYRAYAITNAGADWCRKTAKDEKGIRYTPYEIAAKRGNWGITSYLAEREWGSEYQYTEADEKTNKCGCIWSKFHVQNGYVRKLFASDDNKCTRLLEHITLNFRLGRKPENPVGGSGRESTCIFKKLGDSDLDIMTIAIPYFSSGTTGVIRNRASKSRADIKGYKYTSDSNFNHLGLQCASTLDEYCHPGLDAETLEERNKDQVLSRYQKDLSEDDRRILVVPQLWIWTVDSNFILTALQRAIWKAFEGYTSMEHNVFDLLAGVLDRTENPNKILINASHTESQASPAEQKEVFSKNISIAMLLSMCIDTMDSLSRSNPGPISDSELFAKVRDYTQWNTWSDNNLDVERDFILQIADVRDEISMIKSVISQQKQVWRQFMNAKFPDWGLKSPEDDLVIKLQPEYQQPWALEIVEMLKRPQKQFANYERQIAKLDADAERLEDIIRFLLDLKSKHAGLKEAHLTTLMSAAVIGFTIITIIFTPLAFLATTIEIASFAVAGIAILASIEFTKGFSVTKNIWIFGGRLFGFVKPDFREKKQLDEARDIGRTDIAQKQPRSTPLTPQAARRISTEGDEEPGFLNRLYARRRGRRQQHVKSGGEA
ncbi:hypothetical protein HYALB_00009966 [Hymenoscyphus albidus]|uniref:Ankyrin repeat protein n=1 Tax=Hymenoscyphus albidus TaxID=595503 RepID=A0A9N9QCG1_9HELO|nr:hypothetical protein HYALB_00009966 [Hymenoscyphus albidus]